MRQIEICGKKFTQEQALNIKSLHLYCSDKSCEVNIDELDFFPNLVYLDLSELKLKNFSSITNFKNILKLNLYSTDCPDYSAIAELKQLKCIYLQTYVKDITPILKLENIRRISIMALDYKDAIKLKSKLPKLECLSIPTFKLKKGYPEKTYTKVYESYWLWSKRELNRCINSLDFIIENKLTLEQTFGPFLTGL